MVGSVNSTTNYDRSSMTSQVAQKLFKKIDTNSDGGIDKTELAAIAGSGSESDVSQLFSKMDTNSDGKIDESENESALQKLSEKMESAFQKMNSAKSSRPSPDEMFSKLDSNGDNGIDETEFSEVFQNAQGMGPQFSDIDSNGDGTIDQTENTAAMEKMGPPPGPPPGGMSGMSEDESTSGTASVSSVGNNNFSDLLSALKSTFEDEDDGTDSSIKQLFNELKSNIKYSSQGSLSYSTSGANSLFSLIA
jgi:Ca2+-binding EF-hand superfamily protein